MLKNDIKQKINEIRNKWMSDIQYPDENYKLLNKFFGDIYTNPDDVIFLCFDDNTEHTYYSFKSSIVSPTYSLYSTVPFWYYCYEFSKMDLNVFICPNSFRIPKKMKNYVHGTNCLFVDIDDHDINFLDMDYDDIKKYLNKNYPLTEKIMPAWVSKSGHGLHLYFITERIDFYDSELNIFNNYEIEKRTKLEKSLITCFKGDVKCLDLPREMRLPFSYNNKNNDRIQTVLYCYCENQFLTYDDMYIYLLDDEEINNYFTFQNHLKHSKNKNSSVRKSKKEVENVKSFNSFDVISYYFTHKISKTKNSTMNTILDLEDYYRARFGYTGFRNTFYFIYSLRLKQFKFSYDEALKRCLELNYDDDFSSELEYILKYQYEHNYKITNIKIHELLQFTELEINCFRCAYTEDRKQIDKSKRLKRLSDKRKKERDVKGNKELQIDIIKNNPDMSRQELADILGISIRTVSNIRKQLKEAV